MRYACLFLLLTAAPSHADDARRVRVALALAAPTARCDCDETRRCVCPPGSCGCRPGGCDCGLHEAADRAAKVRAALAPAPRKKWDGKPAARK